MYTKPVFQPINSKKKLMWYSDTRESLYLYMSLKNLTCSSFQLSGMVEKLHPSENPLASMPHILSQSQCGTGHGDIDLLPFFPLSWGILNYMKDSQYRFGVSTHTHNTSHFGWMPTCALPLTATPKEVSISNSKFY